MSFTSPQFLLLLGIALSFIVKDELLKKRTKKWSSKLLQLSVVFLGASLNFKAVLSQGTKGVLVTFMSILTVFILGFIGGKLFKIHRFQRVLITMGTAICGGSAIAALAPVIRADSLAIGVSVGVVFLLNALAVFIFPFIGDFFSLTQEQFGLWAALAIHDTSSVVAASAIYGKEALEIGTTIKLIRALWIIPITLIFSLMDKEDQKAKVSIPWFIIGFISFSLIFTFFPDLLEVKKVFYSLSKFGLAFTLFLIGLSFEWKKIKTLGFSSLLFASSLWIIVSLLSLVFVTI